MRDLNRDKCFSGVWCVVDGVGVWITQVVAWAQSPGVGMECLSARARVPGIMWARLQPASSYDVIITSLVNACGLTFL